MKGLVGIRGDSRQRAYVYRDDGWVRRWRTGRRTGCRVRGGGESEGRIGWSRRVNLSRPLATLSRRAILRITSAASGQEMKIAPTLFNLDKSICYTTNGVALPLSLSSFRARWYILKEATLCLFSQGIRAKRRTARTGSFNLPLTCPHSERARNFLKCVTNCSRILYISNWNFLINSLMYIRHECSCKIVCCAYHSLIIISYLILFPRSIIFECS